MVNSVNGMQGGGFCFTHSGMLSILLVNDGFSGEGKMKNTLALLFLSFIAACGSARATPYTRQPLMPGYSQTQLSPNVFTLTFKGRGYTSRQRASNLK